VKSPFLIAKKPMFVLRDTIIQLLIVWFGKRGFSKKNHYLNRKLLLPSIQVAFGVMNGHSAKRHTDHPRDQLDHDVYERALFEPLKKRFAAHRTACLIEAKEGTL
jgi:phosphoserine phosphatase